MNPPDPLPGWFDITAVIANALPAPVGGNPNHPEVPLVIAMNPQWVMLVSTPEPATIVLLALGALGVLRRKRTLAS